MQKQIKNTIGIKLDITDTLITFCYGEKAYTKHIKKYFGLDEQIKLDGITTVLSKEDDYKIVIGVRKRDNAYELKGLIVHEISHAVTEWMQMYGFRCDEVRSYTLQKIYQEIMPFIDEKLLKQAIKKEDKENKAQEGR